MEKQYRVVVPFGGHEAGYELAAYAKDGNTYVRVRSEVDGPFFSVPFGLLSDKLEEVKPKALRKWFVEEVATRQEASVASNGSWHSANPETGSIYLSHALKIEGEIWVKITEQKEANWVPKLGDKYWSTSDGIDSPDSWPIVMEWDGDRLDLKWLESGDVFKTEAECQAYIDSKKKAA
jgi:hypothetical protein